MVRCYIGLSSRMSDRFRSLEEVLVVVLRRGPSSCLAVEVRIHLCPDRSSQEVGDRRGILLVAQSHHVLWEDRSRGEVVHTHLCREHIHSIDWS